MLRIIAPCILSFTLLGGCGGGTDNDTDNTGSAGSTGDVALSGAWQQPCTYDPDNDIYDQYTLTINGNSFGWDGSSYEDAACSISAFSLHSQGTFLVGSEKILTSGDTVKEIDISPASANMTLHDDDSVLAFNFIAMCGKTDWAKEVAVNIFSCTEFKDVAEKFYDIYKIDGNKIYFGDDSTGDGLSSQTRPTQLESEFLTKS